MRSKGTNNAITDVEGIQVGHYTDEEAASGVTVVLCPQGAVAAVDVRGSAPGTRETDLLEPGNLVQYVQAVALCGGSVYGLSAADGVVRWLSERGFGFPLKDCHVAPIVPAAVLFDLGRGRTFYPPIGPQWGYEACQHAGEGPVEMGSVGAGTGALSGGIKGGVGSASEVLPNGVVVGALAVVNSFGSVVDPRTGRIWEIQLEKDGEFGQLAKRPVRLPETVLPNLSRHTTLGVVATDASLDKAQAKKMASMAHDGLARAIRPAHTLFDGDTIFCLSTCRRPLPRAEGPFPDPHAGALNQVGIAAADVMARAIIRAVISARGLSGIKAFGDLQAAIPTTGDG
jgi:L-aminopeptidase/D-esterase-like protein